MSVHVSSACKKLDYTGAKRAVLLEFADHANDDGICWPGNARIMYNTGLSKSAVKKAISELREKGVLVVMEYHEGGRGRIPIYRVRPEKGPRKTPFEEWKKDVFGEEERGQNLPERGQSVSERGQNLEHEPSGNRQEPSNASFANAQEAGGEPPPPGTPSEARDEKTDSEDFEGWHVEEYLRDELADSDVPLTRSKARRYTGEANKLRREGVEPLEIYEAADRVISEWERVRLSLDDALRDLRGGKQANGKSPPSATGSSDDASATPPEVIEYIFANAKTESIHNNESAIRRALQKHDFTSSEERPWPVMKMLGGSENERWQVQDALEALCRRAAREVA